MPQGKRLIAPDVKGELRELGPRQIEILGLMAKGYNNKAIANKLSISEKSIENQTNDIYSKLEITSESKNQRVSAVITYLKATGCCKCCE